MTQYAGTTRSGITPLRTAPAAAVSGSQLCTRRQRRSSAARRWGSTSHRCAHSLLQRSQSAAGVTAYLCPGLFFIQDPPPPSIPPLFFSVSLSLCLCACVRECACVCVCCSCCGSRSFTRYWCTDSTRDPADVGAEARDAAAQLAARKLPAALTSDSATTAGAPPSSGTTAVDGNCCQ